MARYHQKESMAAYNSVFAEVLLSMCSETKKRLNSLKRTVFSYTYRRFDESL